MKRALRYWLPLAAVAAAAIAAGVLLAIRPWSGEEAVQEAAGSTVKYRLCDTVVEAPPIPYPRGWTAPPIPYPQGRDVVVVGRAIEPTETGDLEPSLEVKLIVPSVGDPSSVSIDPTTATVLEERYSSPAHEALLSPVLETVRFEPLDPATAPWPYTDETQIPVERQRTGAAGYRLPDPASGIVLSKIYGEGDGWSSEGLKAANCRSVVLMTWAFGSKAPQPGLTITRDVHPEDEEAFETFLDAAGVKGDGG